MKNKPYFLLVIGLILAGIASRIMPHIPNFTAIGATALFAGTVLKPRWVAFALPLVALWASDLLLNNGIYKNLYPASYNGWKWIGSMSVYAAFILITCIGYVLIKKIGVKSVLLASVTASMSFFLITNLDVWFNNPLWSQNFGGLMKCYAFALPFFWNTLLGDLVFSAAIFGIYEYVTKSGLITAPVSK